MSTGTNGTRAPRVGPFSLAALALTVILFGFVDGTFVLAFALKEKSLAQGVGMLILIGGPFGVFFGRRVYRWFQRELTGGP